MIWAQSWIIPLREKIGNYDNLHSPVADTVIIPLREKIGNYDGGQLLCTTFLIIPLREKIGNYDSAFGAYSTWFNYTTTRENWELRLGCDWLEVMRYYTTTRENWELRQRK